MLFYSKKVLHHLAISHSFWAKITNLHIFNWTTTLRYVDSLFQLHTETPVTTLTSVIIIPKFVNKYKVSFHILPKLRGPPIKYLVMENQSAGKLSVGKLQQLFFASHISQYYHCISFITLSSSM